MPHQFMTIKCKRCGEWYCPVCKEKCPKCGEIDIADEKTMNIRKQMRRHMNREKKQSMKEKIKIDFLIDSTCRNKERIFLRIKSRIKDLETYFSIKKEYKKRNIKNDIGFQRKYKQFYVMYVAGLTDDFFREYFKLLASRKTDLKKILLRLFEIPRRNKTKSIQFSFATKLLHTVDNSLPIYDSLVGGALGLKVIGKNKSDKINSCIKTYNKLKEYYREMLGNKIIKKNILDFRKKFNCNKEKISDTKVLDFLIWANGQLDS